MPAQGKACSRPCMAPRRRRGHSQTNCAVPRCPIAALLGRRFSRRSCVTARRIRGSSENSLREGREKFLVSNVPKAADGQVRSAAARFALIGMAGELARAYGVVPWPEGEAFQAAKACFQLWLAGRGGAGAAEDAQALETAKTFIALHGASRFLKPRPEAGHADADEDSATTRFEQRIVNRAGYVRTTDGGQEFLVLPPVWRNEIFKGMDPGRAAQALEKAGFLVPGDEKYIHARVDPGGPERSAST